MKTKTAVMDAKRLLDEAQDWWVWTWMAEANKTRVRSAIEHANEALETDIQKAEKTHPPGRKIAQAMKEARCAFDEATALAQQTFDEAERELNVSKARLGAIQAKDAIEKHELILKLCQGERA